MAKVTAQDRHFAAILLDAAEAYTRDESTERTAIETIAHLLADIHERAVACAYARIDNDFALRPRRKD